MVRGGILQWLDVIPAKAGIQRKPEGQSPTCLHVGECCDSEMRW